MPTLDRNSPVPLYFQLKQVLLSRIDSGEWLTGSLIPGELELQQTYDLSRTTVRQTLGDLVSEGRLVRFRGRGTFVAEVRKGKVTHNAAFGLHEAMAMQGFTPGWRLLESDWVSSPPAQVLDHLNLERGDKVYRIVRLRLANDEPIGHHTAWLPASIGRRIDTSLLTEGESKSYLLHLPEMRHAMARRAIEAVCADARDAQLLLTTEGQPVLAVHRLVRVADQPVEYLQARYLGSRYKYEITRPL